MLGRGGSLCFVLRAGCRRLLFLGGNRLAFWHGGSLRRFFHYITIALHARDSLGTIIAIYALDSKCRSFQKSTLPNGCIRPVSDKLTPILLFSRNQRRERFFLRLFQKRTKLRFGFAKFLDEVRERVYHLFCSLFLRCLCGYGLLKSRNCNFCLCRGSGSFGGR